MAVDMNCCHECSERHLYCRSSCEKWAARQEVIDRMREDRDRNRLLLDHAFKAVRNFQRDHHTRKEWRGI